MKPASSSSSTSSCSSSTSSLSSGSTPRNNHNRQSAKAKHSAGSGSFDIINEKILSLSSTSSSSSSSSSSQLESGNQDSSDQPPPPRLEAPSAYDEDEPPNISSSPQQQQQHEPKLSEFTQRLMADYDAELEKLGDRATDAVAKGSFFNFGFFQFVSFLFISVAWTVGNGWYAYVSVFTGYTPEHECDYLGMGGNFTPLPANHSLLASDESAKNCYAYDPIKNDTVKCTRWKYQTTQMHSTIITEYDFVCEKNYYFETAYSIEQVGYIVGTLIFSFVADIIGRKPVMVAVLWSMCIFGFVQYFVQNFWIYIGIGFVINSLACGLEAVCVTLVLELFSTSKRTLFGIGLQVVWVIVLASMSPLAYVIKTWREIRLVIFGTLALLSIFSNVFVQESTRWLISTSRLNACSKIIDRVAVFNRLRWSENNNNTAQTRHFEKKRKKLAQMFAELEAFNKLKVKSIEETSSSSKSQMILALDMFKNGKFRLYVLIMALNWFATALVYDGIMYLNNFIGENIYLNWVIMNLIELPAQFVCYYLISRSGRRFTVALTLILSGVTLLATLLVEFFESKSTESLSWLKLVLFVAAKFIITQSYSAIILHAPELFPTNLRSFGYGICLFSGKITAVLSPIISLYVSKIAPSLPPVIYGTLSILCGLISLYVPETLNRPLPNSVDDVVKWPRSLSADEWKVVRKLNDNEIKLMFKCCYKIKTSKRTAPEEIKKESVDEQQKCVYGAKNAGKTVVNNSSSAVLVEEQEKGPDQDLDLEQSITL